MDDGKRDVWIDGRWVSTAVYERDALAVDVGVSGPALIEQYDTCTYVPPQWQARSNGAMLIVERAGAE